MSLPRYPEYRPSSVRWVGDIPSHWSMSRLDHEAWVRARLGWKGLKAEEYVEDGHVFLATPNIKGAEIDFENVNYINEMRFEESPEIKLRIGDVLLAKDGSTLGTVNVVRHLPRPSTVNSSIAVISPGKRVNGVFLYYLFQSAYLENTIQRIKGGMGVPHLFQEDLNRFHIPLPPTQDQEVICKFLEGETAKIDALVTEKEHLITLLKEKRQAVISHAVTKGLNPDAPMKPSGIEWLGDVPAHWKIEKIKHTIRSIEQGWSPQCENYPAEEGGWGVLKVGCVNGGQFSGRENKALPEGIDPMADLGLKAGDLLISRANTRELVGGAAVVPFDTPQLLLCDKLYRLRFQSGRLHPQFAAFYLSTPGARGQIELDATGASASMVNIGQGTILEMSIVIPTWAEQQHILAFILSECGKLDKLSQEGESAVSLLRERRSALISAAVTGQIDVRNAA